MEKLIKNKISQFKKLIKEKEEKKNMLMKSRSAFLKIVEKYFFQKVLIIYTWKSTFKSKRRKRILD